MAQQQKRSLHQAVSTELIPVAVPSEPPPPPSSNDIIKTRLVTMAASVLLLVVVVVLGFTILGHLSLMISSTQVLVYILDGAVGALLIGAVVLVPMAWWQRQQRQQRMEEKRQDAELYLAVWRLPADELGNRALPFNPYTGGFVPVPNGNFAPPVPHTLTWSPRSDYRDTSTRVQEVPSELQPPPPIPIPTFRQCWEQGLIRPDQPDALLCFQLLEDHPKTRAVIGIKPVRGMLEDNCTTVVTGDMKSGKSTDMALLGGQYAGMGALLALVDPHLLHPERSIARKLAPLREAFLCDPSNGSPNELDRIYRLLREEADLRVNHHDSRYDWRPIVVIVDEILALMTIARTSEDDRVRKLYYHFAVFLCQLSTQFAKFGMCGIIASQYATKADFKVKYKGTEVDFRDGCVNQTTFRLPGNQVAALHRIDSTVKPYVPDLPTGQGYMAMPGEGTLRMATPLVQAGDLTLIAPAICPTAKYRSTHFAVDSQETPSRLSGVSPDGSTGDAGADFDEEDVDDPSLERDEGGYAPPVQGNGVHRQQEPSGDTPESLPPHFKALLSEKQQFDFKGAYEETGNIEKALRKIKVSNDYWGHARHLVTTHRLRKKGA